MSVYIVRGFRSAQVADQWVINATTADEACCFAERSQAGVADFDTFEAEPDLDGLFEAEENFTEDQQ